jgi:hypothetical protein
MLGPRPIAKAERYTMHRHNETDAPRTGVCPLLGVFVANSETVVKDQDTGHAYAAMGPILRDIGEGFHEPRPNGEHGYILTRGLASSLWVG